VPLLLDLSAADTVADTYRGIDTFLTPHLLTRIRTYLGYIRMLEYSVTDDVQKVRQKYRPWQISHRSFVMFVCQHLYVQSDAKTRVVSITVRRRSRRTFSTHFEIFRRRFDGVVIYFFNSDFKFFDDASEFSVTSFYVVFIFS